MTTTRLVKLSASSIQAFKACPTRYRLQYVEGIRAERDTDSQRVGTNWHALHEVYRNALAEELQRLYAEVDRGTRGDDMVPEEAHEAAFAAAIEHLNEAYAAVPDWIDDADWALERQVLATSFAAYLWYYSDDPVETMSAEYEFELPVHNPQTGLPLPLTEVMRVGKIDGMIRYAGMTGQHEYKSTTRSIEDGSDYWERLKLDDQISMYDLAVNDLTPDRLEALGVDGDAELGGTLYDVWHKPSISQKELSQKDTAAFLENATYYGDEYRVEVEWTTQVEVKELKSGTKEIEHRVPATITIDGEPAEFTISKTYKPALRETVTMFGSRLMADIADRPSFYFRRRKVVRTADERGRFRQELFNVYNAMRMYERSGCWFQNGAQCRATFPCDMIPICHGPKTADEVCHEDTAPAGFRRRAKLTIGETD